MAQDIDIMRSIVRHASRFVKTDQFVDLKGVVEELWQSFREETNFLMEARNLDDFHRFHEGSSAISCPKSYLPYCTEHIVVMDYVDGISIADPAALEEAGYDLKKVGASIVDDYATQVLDDGFFHADPHAGNIIVKKGVVYFIDLGMVGRMSGHDRGIVKDMIYAVASGDVPKLKDSLMRFAVTRGDSSELDHSAFLTDLDFIIADFAGLDLRDLDIGEFLTSLISLARKNDVELPAVVTMFARGMVTLEGLLTEYMPDVNMIDIITEHIRHEKSSYARAREAAEDLTHASYRALKGHLEMAEQLGLASRMLTRGQLKMNMQVLGSEQVLRHVGGIVDRLSMAIVIAGLFIGSSVVYYAKIEPVIFGIPVIGFLGYASALFLALGLGREYLAQRPFEVTPSLIDGRLPRARADDLGIDGYAPQRAKVEDVLLDAEGDGAHAHQVERIPREYGGGRGHARAACDAHVAHEVLGDPVIGELGIQKVITCELAQLAHVLRGGNDLDE